MPATIVETRQHVVAVEGDRVTGTLGVLLQPGRVGLVFPPELDRASDDVGTLLVDAALRRLKRDGAAFAQLTLSPQQAGLERPFVRCGFEFLTEAVTMEWRPGADTAAASDDPGLRGVMCDPVADRSRVIDLIRRIHFGSLDCPELDSLRSPEDLFEAHAGHSSGDRARWWRYEEGASDMGIALGAEIDGESTWELLYFGILPEQRGRGQGRRLMGDFLRRATREGRSVRVGFDVRNRFAETVYRSVGFAHGSSLRVWIHWLRTTV
jgi:mycothiol synthase